MSSAYGNIVFDNAFVTAPGTTSVMTVAGNFTLQNGAMFQGSNGTTGYTFTSTGTGNQTITGNGDSLVFWSFDIGNTNTKGTGTVTLVSNTPMKVGNTMIMNLSGATNQFNDGGNNILVVNNLDLTGNASSYNLTGTVYMAGVGSGSQNIRGGGVSTLPCIAALNNLVLQNGINVQVRGASGGSTLTVKGNLTLNSLATATLVMNGNTIALGGDLINSEGAAAENINTTATGSAFIFNGTGTQHYTSNLSGGDVLPNVAINNGSSLILNNNLSVSTLLTLTSGIIYTGTNSLTLTSTGSVSGGSATSYVAGNYVKVMPSGGVTTLNYEIGDLTYSPIQLHFSSSVSSGSITVSSTAGTHSAIATSGIFSGNCVNRYWTITNNGVSVSSVNASFSYNSTDITGGGGSNTGYQLVQYNGSSWSAAPSITNTTSASAPLLSYATSSTGISGSSFSGDYVAGASG